MTLEGNLAQLGLKDNEINVYLATLKLGESTVGEIEKHTNLHKQLIYNAAESLQTMGLLSIYEVRGRKRFAVQDPTAIEERARLKLQQAQTVTPQLLELANTKRSVDDIRIWHGQRGVQQYYLDTIRHQPKEIEVSILGVDSKRFFEIFPQDDIPYQRLEQLRLEKKMRWRVLLFGERQEEVLLNKKRLLVEMRLIKEAVQSPIDMMVWGDRVGLLFYGTEPYVMDIAGIETVNGFREYFEVLWRQGEKILG